MDTFALCAKRPISQKTSVNTCLTYQRLVSVMGKPEKKNWTIKVDK